jgi:hypothetical protein
MSGPRVQPVAVPYADARAGDAMTAPGIRLPAGTPMPWRAGVTTAPCVQPLPAGTPMPWRAAS